MCFRLNIAGTFEFPDFLFRTELDQTASPCNRGAVTPTHPHLNPMGSTPGPGRGRQNIFFWRKGRTKGKRGRRAHLERRRVEKVERGSRSCEIIQKVVIGVKRKKEEELRGREKMGGDAVFPSGDEI